MLQGLLNANTRNFLNPMQFKNKMSVYVKCYLFTYICTQTKDQSASLEDEEEKENMSEVNQIAIDNKEDNAKDSTKVSSFMMFAWHQFALFCFLKDAVFFLIFFRTVIHNHSF